MSLGWAATRFDGHSAAGEVVLVRVDAQTLVVLGRSSLDRIPIAEARFSEAFDRAPRMIGLPQGITLEVADPEGTLSATLAQVGLTPSWVVRMQRAWIAVVLALGLVAAIGVWIYLEGLPAASRAIALAMPPALERRMGENLLDLLDQRWLRPSTLEAARKTQIASRFRDAAARVAPDVEVRLEFRAGSPNAFAMPGGIIVLFDDLVELAGDDERLLGVLGHELGHVVHRHSTRQLMQALGTGALAGLVWGDFSTVAANVPLVLGMMRYGRAFEEEADTYAIDFLRANGISPRALYEFFVRIQGLEGRRGADGPEFMSTHPDPGARTERLRQAAEAFEAEAKPR